MRRLIVGLALLLPAAAPASEEAARRFTDVAARELGLEPSACPPELRGYLPLSEVTCTTTGRSPKKFKRSWEALLADPAKRDAEIEPETGWSDHRTVCLARHREVWGAFWQAIQSPDLPITPVPDGGGWPGFARTFRVDGTPVTVHYAEDSREVFFYFTRDVPVCPKGDPQGHVPGIDGVVAPQVVEEHHAGPVYPVLPRMAKIQATVVLRTRVDTDGRTGDLCVVQCNHTDLGFEEAALEAVGRWRYLPATLDGQPVEVTHTVTVEFHFQ